MSYPLADALYQRLLDALPPGRPYDRTALDTDVLPRLVGHFIRHRLQHCADAEIDRLRSTRDPWFDHHHPDVQAAYEQYAAALTTHAHVPADAWQDTLRHAVDTVVDYLVRPADALAGMLYDAGDGPLPAHRVLQSMTAFAAYPYLRDVLGAYVEEKQVNAFERGRLATLLTRIDREMTKASDTDDWLRLLRPLFDLARHADLDALSTATLRTFFTTRGADTPARRLANEEARGRTRLDEAALRAALEQRPPADAPDAPRTTPDALRTAPERARPSAVPQPSAPAGTARPPSSASAESAGGAVPLWKKYQQGRPAAETPSSRPQQQPPAAAKGEAVPLWKRFHKAPDAPGTATGPAPAESPSHSDLAELERDVLGDAAAQDRRRYVRDLFSGSEADYAAVLERLRTTDAWADASQIIARDVFRRHQVNIYSESAVAFTDAVERRYRS